jgi:hypothetical protein
MELSVRRTLRQLTIVAFATAALVWFAGSAHAAVTVRALWNMDGQPTMVDSAGGDNNGTASKIKLSGDAYVFNGTSSYATAHDKANLDPGAAPAKLTARVSLTKAPRVGQTFDIVRKGTAPTPGGYYKIEIMRSSTGLAIAACRFRDGSGRTADAFGTAGLAGRGFVTITCTKTASRVTVSAGGRTDTAANKVGTISNAAPVYIGAKGDGTDWFPGRIDFVKIEIG